MKPLYTLIISVLFFVSCSGPPFQNLAEKTESGSDKQLPILDTIQIKGSSTMAPILKSIASYYQTTNHVQINITSTGSNEGIKYVFSGGADIGMSSHAMSDSVVRHFRKHKKEYAEFLLAGDALVFIININNPVKKITAEQLKDIYTGEITNWESIGGHDDKIKLFSREKISGSFSFLIENILDGKMPPKDIEYLKDQKEIIRHVSKEKDAIGFISFSNLDYSVDPLNISFDKGKTFIQPRMETVTNLKYKYYRGLYLYYQPESYSKIQSFLDTVKSDTVQKMIRDQGYIPLSNRFIANH